ncbi:mediator complex subunit [Apophysomyces sp. BC1021]|nr:mediator complex subunit [Apophysomyces sp. BC1021]
MVEITPTKRRRIESSPETAARYPLSFLFSSLTYRQAPECLSTSSQSVVVTVPPNPNPPAINTITGDLYTNDLNKFLCHKTPVRLAEQYHKQHTITHLKWNHRGTALLSADETGKLAIWSLDGSVDNWSLTFEIDLQQPLAALVWLNADRFYAAHDTTTFTREKVLGPRNPYGYMAFVAITVHGEVNVQYQRNGPIFSSFRTTLPKSARDTSRSDVGCFGMVLAGLDDWRRISHAAATFGQDGNIYLATHYASTQPKSIHLYKIAVQFPTNPNQCVVCCQSVANIRLSTPPPLANFDPASVVTQLLLIEKNMNIQVVVGFGVTTDASYTGYLGRWELQEISHEVPIKSDTDEYIRDRRSVLKYKYGFSIPNCFITSLACTRGSGALALGLSDGSIHMQYRESGDRLGLFKGQTLDNTISPEFWQAVAPRQTSSGHSDTVAGIVFSPNGTHLMYIYSSGDFETTRVTDDEATKDIFNALEQLIKLGLLNNTDTLDIISELVRFGRCPEHKDIPEQIVNEALAAYEIYCGQGDANIFQAKPGMSQSLTTPDDWNLAQLGQAYGLALGTYKRLPTKRIQYINLTKAIQLPVILECFLGSCTSDYSDITEVLESKTVDIKHNLEFEPDSLWSLVSLANWILDLVRWMLREWNMLFNCKRPKNSKFADISARPVHAVLLVHKVSRVALQQILIMIHQFVQFITTSSYELVHLPESRPLLQRCAFNLLQNEPVALEDVLSFLFALDELEQSKENVNQWSLLLSSRLPQSVIAPAKVITAKYKDKCAQPAIYLEPHKEQLVDVICKRRIQPTQKVRCCVR